MLQPAMTVKVNGQDREYSLGVTVHQVIAGHGLAPEKVAVELNRKLLRTPQYDTQLKGGDELEIVTFVGGG